MQKPKMVAAVVNPNPGNFMPMILKWAAAVTAAEKANPKYNNPGNLKLSSLTASWGGTSGRAATDGGFLCQFPTPQMGLNALCSFLTLGAEDQLVAFHSVAARTLEGFTTIYAGNPPQGYKDSITKALGVPSTTLISTFLQASVDIVSKTK